MPSNGWERPTQLLQGELFARPRDQVLALARVSIEEMENWRARGWISYDARDLAALDEGQVFEMVFVRNIARAGLSQPQVTSLLGELDKPYRYDPSRVVFSFADGWVQMPRLPAAAEWDEYMRDNVDAWISRLEEDRDRATLERLGFRIINARLHLQDGEPKEIDEEP